MVFDSSARMVAPLATGDVDVGSGAIGAATYNAFAATVAKALSLAVSPGTYYYDLFIDWAGGTSQEFLAGLFVVESSVSR